MTPNEPCSSSDTAVNTGADVFFVENSPWAGYTNYSPACSSSANLWMQAQVNGKDVLDTVQTHWIGDEDFYLLGGYELWPGEGIHWNASAAAEIAREAYDTTRPCYP